DLNCRFTASNGLELLEKLDGTAKIDLILMDIEMPKMNGIEATEIVKQKYPHLKIIMLTVFDNDENIFKSIKAGADGYLLKDTEPDMLLAELADVMTGKQILSEPLRPYLENIYELDHLQQKLESLTRREMQIMREIAKGLSNKQVASVLHISEGTVKVHVKSLLKKLEAQSRVEAAVMYLEQRN
ncbi:MAG: response regulator transcription factor, partial [Pseudorhodobacter sp.]